MAEARIATVTMKSDRPTTVARFWRDLLGYDVAPNHSDSIMLVAPGQPSLLIQRLRLRQERFRPPITPTT